MPHPDDRHDIEVLRQLLQIERQIRGEAERQAALERQLDALKSRVTVLLCHDLRGALCVVSGFMDMAHEDLQPSLDASTREMLQSATSQMDRLLSLLQEIADFGQIQLPDETTSRRASLEQIVDELLPAVRMQYTPAGLHLDVGMQPGAGECQLPSDLATLMLRSLLGTFTRLDPRPEQVRLRARLQGASVEAELTAAGAGLPRGTVSSLDAIRRDPFATPPLNSGSLALGIWIAERAAALLGGQLVLRADPTGLRYALVLPAVSTARSAPSA